MKHSNLFTLNATIALAFGIGFDLLPAIRLPIYGVDPNLSVLLADIIASLHE